jgi:hypothetical protein
MARENFTLGINKRASRRRNNLEICKLVFGDFPKSVALYERRVRALANHRSAK